MINRLPPDELIRRPKPLPRWYTEGFEDIKWGSYGVAVHTRKKHAPRAFRLGCKQRVILNFFEKHPGKTFLSTDVATEMNKRLDEISLSLDKLAMKGKITVRREKVKGRVRKFYTL